MKIRCCGIVTQPCFGREAECRSKCRMAGMPALRAHFPSRRFRLCLGCAATIIAGGPPIRVSCTARERKPMAVSAQAQSASGQTVEAYVGEQMDNAQIGRAHV